MTALIYEIIWIRPLSLVFGATIYAVTTIVASFILGLAIGSWLAGRYTDRLQNPLKYFALIQIAIGFFGILLLPIFGILPSVYLNLYQITYENQTVFLFMQILMSMAIITIPATLMGTTLPLMMKIYSKEITTVGKDVGKLDASNSIGAFFGTMAAGFVLIPLLGIQDGVLVTASINIIMGTVILIAKKYFKIKYISIIFIVLISLAIFYPSYDVEGLAVSIFLVKPDMFLEKYDLEIVKRDALFYRESLYQNVMVNSNAGGGISLLLNGKVQCDTSEATTDGLVNLAFIPFDLYMKNYEPPQNALNVGLGCGVTSSILSKNVNTTTIEIDSAVVEANKFFYDSINHKLIIDDARNWLLRNNEKFDVITSEPTEPWTGGQLYTKEHFEILSDSLTEHGILAQWIPYYELHADDNLLVLYNTFHSVFPFVYVYTMETGDSSQLIFIGSHQELKTYESKDYLFNQNDVKDVKSELNTDDKPIIEFAAIESLHSPEYTKMTFPLNNDKIYAKINALK